MTAIDITRRQFVGGLVATSLLESSFAQSSVDTNEGRVTHNLYWGDLHNHNAVGYAKGSLERSIELAQEHLDFFAFTGHSS